MRQGVTLGLDAVRQHEHLLDEALARLVAVAEDHNVGTAQESGRLGREVIGKRGVNPNDIDIVCLGLKRMPNLGKGRRVLGADARRVADYQNFHQILAPRRRGHRCSSYVMWAEIMTRACPSVYPPQPRTITRLGVWSN